MSQNKRDEMAAEFVRKKSFSFHPDEKARHEDVYKVAWDAALTHAPEVQALCEALEFYANPEHWAGDGKQVCYSENPGGQEAREVLAIFRAAIQGGEE